MMTDHHSPCEQVAIAGQRIEDLTRWQRTQNGSLVKLTEEVGNMRIAQAEMRVILSGLADDSRWTRRLMIATVVTTVGSIAARYIGVL